MGSAKTQGELWGQAPSDWASIQEPQHNPLFEAMMNASGVQAGTRVLDVGCGGGGASMIAYDQGAQVTGLDAAEGLIEIARQLVPSGDFRVGDLEELPFASDSFDAVLAPNSIQYAEDRIVALRELSRVCTAEGRIVVGLFAEAEKVEFRHLMKAMSSALPEPPTGAGPFGLSTPGTLEGLIEEAGLTVLETHEVDCPFSYPDFETFWKATIAGGPPQRMLRIIGEKQLKSVLEEAVEPYRTDDGFVIAPNYFKYVVAKV